MSLHRSPPASGTSSPFRDGLMSSSQPDLSCYDHQVSQRKRKQMESDFVTPSQLSDFRVEMMDFLNNFGRTQKEEFNSVKKNIVQFMGQLESIKTNIEKLTIDNNNMKTDIKELKESLDYFSAEQVSVVKRIDNVCLETKKISKLELDILDLKKCYDNLQNEQNIQQQRLRISNLDISEIPEKQHENLVDYVFAIAKHAGVAISQADIIQVHRVQPRNYDPKKPRNIVVQLGSPLLKDKIISGIRKKKGITTLDIGLPGLSRNIYVNEHLTTNNKKLLKETKEAARACVPKYEYVWVRNCKIYRCFERILS